MLISELQYLLEREELARGNMCMGWSGTERNLHALTAGGHAGLLPARNDDIVDEAGERRNAADKEGRYSPPIASPPGRVAIDAMEIVHIGN